MAEDLGVAHIHGHVLNGVGRLSGLEQPHLPDVVGGLVDFRVQEVFGVFRNALLGAGALGHTPAPVPNIPHSFVVLRNRVVVDLVGDLAMVSVVLEGRHEPSLVEQGGPLLRALLDHIHVILS